MTLLLLFRFARTSRSAYWNTGNGSPDAVTFTVDRPGVLIAGVALYGGGGDYDFDIELLDEVLVQYARQPASAIVGMRGFACVRVYLPSRCVE